MLVAAAPAVAHPTGGVVVTTRGAGDFEGWGSDFRVRGRCCQSADVVPRSRFGLSPQLWMAL